MPARSFFLVVFALAAAAGTPAALAGDGNRLAYLDGSDPFHVSRDFPRLTTPQWIGEEGVDAVVILAIDDMRDYRRYEDYLRPILDRLKKIDGRAPVSIMTNRIDPEMPELQRWLEEGVSIECHTLDHPCPLLAGGDFEKAKATYDGCIDLLSRIPGTEPVAFRVPCMDSLNTPSPRFFAEIFNKTTPEGRFLRIDSSIVNVTTPDDPELPRDLVLDPDGREKFRKYIPFPSFVNTVEDYPYPWVIDRLCWELPCVVPSDWEAQNLHGKNHPLTVRDLCAQLDVTVIKRGAFTLVFHPHGWIRNDQIVELIDHAVSEHGERVRFLNFQEVAERLRENLLAGHPLRASGGGDNGVRLLDLDADGHMDVVIGNDRARLARIWRAGESSWSETPFPTRLVETGADGRRRDAGIRFGVLGENARTVAFFRSETSRGAWRFADGEWREIEGFFRGLELDGEPILTVREGRDTGVRLRDLDRDGACELIAGGPGETAALRWLPDEKRWRKLPFSLPPSTSIVDARGLDAGLRFVDVDGDLRDDVVHSNEERYSLHLFESMEKGWGREVLEGRRGEGDASKELPMITRDGRQNGAWFHSRHLWVQNEDTAEKEDLVERRSFNDLLEDVEPRALSPEASCRAIRASPGLAVELVASEPLVRDPVAFDWDADGRLWVVEMIDYPKGTDGKGKAGGRVVVLEDTDGDGRYDRSRVFLSGLLFPTAVHPWRGGALVTAIPEIFWAEDADGDGEADTRRPLYTGFAHGNEQHLTNTLAWGIDNWIHCANGDSGGTVRSASTGASVDLGGRDFRIRPDTGRIDLETGRTQFGRARDDWGNWFGCSNPQPMFHFVLADRYIRRNPRVAGRGARRDVVPAAGRVYPRSRTLPRFNDLHMADRFTSCCGLAIYRDTLLGESLRGNAFVSEPAHNLVHRIVLEPQGVTFDGRRASGEERSEFLASTDNWFRPTTIRTGPDGALWIADMYRAVIEHPQYFYLGDFRDLDVRAGDDRGRIYRVRPVGRRPRPMPRLGRRDGKGLVEALRSPNGWVRDKAQELIVTRRPEGIEKLLREAALEGGEPLLRLHALASLDGIRRITADVIERALADPHPGVRRHAVRLSERLAPDASRIAERLAELAGDPDPHVRLQLAYTLGEWRSPLAGAALAELALRHPDDPHLNTAVLSSASPHLDEIARKAIRARGRESLAEESAFTLMERILPALAESSRGTSDLFLHSVSSLLERRGGERPAARWNALATLFDALSSLPSGELEPFREALGKDLASALEEARRAAADPEAEETARIAAARLLGESAAVRDDERGIEEDLSVIARLLSPRNGPALQAAAVESVARLGGTAAPRLLLSGWRSHSPPLRRRILDALLERAAWLDAVLEAVEQGEIRAAEIGPTHRRRLLERVDPAERDGARKLLAASAPADREQVIERFRKTAEEGGSAERGAALFEKTCSPCHRLGETGHAVGPDLAALTDRSVEALLVAILDPDRNLEPRYTQYSVLLRDGRVLAGVVTEETGTSITLLGEEAKETVILRREIELIESTGTSLMPQGLEQGLGEQDIADIIAFVNHRGDGERKERGHGEEKK